MERANYNLSSPTSLLLAEVETSAEADGVELDGDRELLVHALELISELPIVRLGPPFGELVKAVIKLCLTEA